MRTIQDANFQANRLLTPRTRNSAAYKGIHPLLMRDGSRDFRTSETRPESGCNPTSTGSSEPAGTVATAGLTQDAYLINALFYRWQSGKHGRICIVERENPAFLALEKFSGTDKRVQELCRFRFLPKKIIPLAPCEDIASAVNGL